MSSGGRAARIVQTYCASRPQGGIVGRAGERRPYCLELTKAKLSGDKPKLAENRKVIVKM
jgi:hypothetical protein